VSNSSLHTTGSPDLLGPLARYFGFSTFRPLQEEIIRDALAGKDVFALLPTGGGKSLCFQLPALVRPGLSLVVSPLIALMKDQVDSLQASGVPATFLNSSLSADESRSRLRRLRSGDFRLLYVAPERLKLSGFLAELQRWNVNLLAIDEAHCISEWGHDFRPEYRQLAGLREAFPKVPMMALTATATERVRTDIVRLLELRDAACYVASFNRQNLIYRVVPKTGAYEQTLHFLRARERDCGIVYCQSRKTVELVAARLDSDGVKAAPYHAGMDAKSRADNQEKFLRDEVRVICATIAFGMGINKPNVRFVVHYDLPRNIEGYYQETGRAGRDGLPAVCLLLFSAGDVVKQTRFIEVKSDPRERQITRDQLQQMIQYAELSTCRRTALLTYFGETFRDSNCGACDNCLSPRETRDATVAAQKMLSCVYRIRERSGFDLGMNHVIEVLTGADTEKIRKWQHSELSTYGVGRDQARAEWQALGRELIRLGYLRQSSGRFSVIELTPEGLTALSKRTSVTMARPAAEFGLAMCGPGGIECDELLFERLRQLRRRLADQQDVPSYVIFSDVSLRQMAQVYPTSATEFAGISGVGERKLREFGATFLAEISEHLRTHPRRTFGVAASAFPPPKPRISDSAHESLKQFQSGRSVEQIAIARGFTVGTICSHLADMIENGAQVDLGQFVTIDQLNEIAGAFDKHGAVSLGLIREQLGNRYDYGVLRICRAARNQAQRAVGPG
jgi:ATP-dependent DNA helicase RecQ